MEKIIYFVKYPRIGKVKTRLAASIGNNNAFAVYNLLLKQNWIILKSTKTLLQVEFTPAHMRENTKVLFPEADGFSEQSGKTIGDRMANAFKKTITNQEDSVVLLGSDLADLLQSDIITAFRKLTRTIS